MDNKDQVILCRQYHGCWCPGDARSQDIGSHGIDLEHSDFSSKKIDIFINLYHASLSSWCPRRHLAQYIYNMVQRMTTVTIGYASHDAIFILKSCALNMSVPEYEARIFVGFISSTLAKSSVCLEKTLKKLFHFIYWQFIFWLVLCTLMLWLIAWHQTDSKPLLKPVMIQFAGAYMCHIASLALYTRLELIWNIHTPV